MKHMVFIAAIWLGVLLSGQTVVYGQPAPEWIRYAWQESGTLMRVYAIEADEQGLYLAGAAYGAPIFDDIMLPNDSDVNTGAFLAKYGPDGTLSWAQRGTFRHRLYPAGFDLSLSTITSRIVWVKEKGHVRGPC